jgi:hypothetical protein
MIINGYIIPLEAQKNSFIRSLMRQVERGRELTPKQIDALEDTIGVELEFTRWDYDIRADQMQLNYISIYENLIEKLRENRFRKTRTRNACIRALNSIVDQNVSWHYIEKALP